MVTWVGLAVGAAIMWAAVVGFAYARRPFGGFVRNYILAFVALWAITIGSLTLMALLEHS